MQQQRNPTTMSQMMAQILDLQDKVNSLSDARIFLRSWERPTFLIKLLRFWVSGLCHAATLDCRKIHRIVRILWETFFERPPAQEGLCSTIFHNSKILASSSQGLRLDISEWNIKSYWWNLFSQWYDGLSESSSYGMESWTISWLCGISKLEA